MVHTKGKFEVICGSMFSGKSEELIRRLRRAQIAQLEVQVRLYDQLAQKSSRIDTDCEEQRGSLQDVLREIKVIIDECNVRLNKALTKYPSLRQELNLKGNLTLNLSVDSDTN